MSTICFDFGNTRLKGAFFKNGNLSEVVYLENGNADEISKIIEKFNPLRSILSSVVNHDVEIENILAKRTRFHLLNHLSKLPITTPVGKPETIGADRLALCSAAVSIFPDQHNLAIGLGSCITYNFINREGAFMGGSISPGLEMRFKAMNHFTAKLPLVKANWNVPLIGYDTATNLQSGVILGIAKEIDGIIEAYAKRYSNFNVLLTGGDTVHLASHLKNKIFADPELIFKGLYAICDVNNP